MNLENKINEEYSNTTGIVILKNGQKEYECYFNGCNDGSTVHIYSVTKSVVSILIGIAIDKGYIKNVKQKVLDFFPDYVVNNNEETIQKITLENLLTMTAPYKYEEAPYIEYFTSSDWVKFSLDLLGGKDSLDQFKYAPLIGLDILSGILVKATGESVLTFATKNLFLPLGIKVADNIVFHSEEEQLAFNSATNISGWVADCEGINAGGWGLTLSTMDMAKIGQLYLNEGIWKGKQIVSKKWINESIKEHSRYNELNLPYGYLWWLDDDHNYMAMGDGGNVIYVNPQKQLVIAITALFMLNAKDRIELIKNFIEKSFE